MATPPPPPGFVIEQPQAQSAAPPQVQVAAPPPPPGFVVEGMPQQPAAPPAATQGGLSLDVDAGSPLLEAGLQGATLGFSDEGQALLGAVWDEMRTLGGADFGARYDLRREAINRGLKRFADENPGSSLALNLLGGLATGGAALQGLKAAGVGVQGLRGAARAGAAIGGTAGAGTADPDGRIEGAVTGGMFGGVLGPLMVGAHGGAKALLRRLAPGERNRLAAMAEQTGLTPAQIATRLQALGPRSTLADVSEVFRAGADAAAARLGPTMKRVQELVRRDEGQFGRLMEPIRRTLGGQEQAIRTVGQLKDLRMQQASPLYERAFEQGVQNTNRLRDLLSRPETAKAWRAVQRIGQSDPDIDPALLGQGEPSLRGWQEITESLWDRASSLDRAGRSKLGGKIKSLRRAIQSELDAQSPDYRQARQLWAGTAQADDMLETGRAIFKVPIDELRQTMKGASDADKAFLRLGVGRAIEERMAAAVDTKDLTLLARNPAFRQKVYEVFPSRESAVDFLNTVRAEAQKKITSNTVGRNSQTAPRQAAARQMGGAQIGAEDMTRAGALNRLMSGLGAPRERTIQGLGELLLSQDPATQQRALQMIQQGRPKLPALMTIGDRQAGFVGGATTAAGN